MDSRVQLMIVADRIQRDLATAADERRVVRPTAPNGRLRRRRPRIGRFARRLPEPATAGASGTRSSHESHRVSHERGAW